MLLRIHPLLTPDLLHALASMGHGDRRRQFPGGLRRPARDRTAGRRCAGGAGGDPHAVPAPVAAFAAVFTERGLADAEIGSLERHAFYERARAAFAVVRTGELRKYGNLLLVKGVVNRYEPA